MPFPVQFYHRFKGFAIAQEDVNFNEVESQEIDMVRGRQKMKVTIVRYGATINIRGITKSQAAPFIQEANNSVRVRLFGLTDGEDLVIGTRTLYSAVLIRATPVPIPLGIAGLELLDSLSLEYHSLVFV
jgi:hypothetical protein